MNAQETAHHTFKKPIVQDPIERHEQLRGPSKLERELETRRLTDSKHAPRFSIVQSEHYEDWLQNPPHPAGRRRSYHTLASTPAYQRGKVPVKNRFEPLETEGSKTWEQEEEFRYKF
ncbi:unnamed protein product [Cercospora beticola]|nr:unnamed protein product [Cercospora beticola]